MITAAELKQFMAAMVRLQPCDRLQGVTLFTSGRVQAMFPTSIIQFESFARVERLLDYQHQQTQGLNGEGI